MKFCPRCGGLMVPWRKGDAEDVVLRCSRCGYEERLVESRGYTLSGRTPLEERILTTSRVSEARRRPPKTLEEWEQEREEYREILQELLQEELEGREE